MFRSWKINAKKDVEPESWQSHLGWEDKYLSKEKHYRFKKPFEQADVEDLKEDWKGYNVHSQIIANKTKEIVWLIFWIKK